MHFLPQLFHRLPDLVGSAAQDGPGSFASIMLGLPWSDFVILLSLVCLLPRDFFFQKKTLTNAPLPLPCPL